jgi:anionic cell wall polymer biosynthesis LytR-Cps2A-Psr (LCP) family protein
MKARMSDTPFELSTPQVMSPEAEESSNTPLQKLRFSRNLIFLSTITGLLAGLAVLAGAFFLFTRAPAIVPNDSTKPSPSPEPIRTERNYLLLGYGGGGHSGGKLTDTVMIASLRPDDHMIALISLPRDLWVQFPVNGDQLSGWKLNAAYALGSDDRGYPRKLAQYTGTHGGGELAKYAVNKATGLQIDRYVAVDFASFTKTVDLVNGVDVKVERTFDDYQYPIEGKEEDTCGKSQEELTAINATVSAEQAEKLFGCRYEHLHFDRGTQHMDGTTALKFARSRHSAQDGNDFGRSERQKLVILALKDKMLQVSFLPKLPAFALDMMGKLSTDFTLGDFNELFGKKDEYNGYAIVNISLTDKNVLHSGRSSTGAYVLLPRAGEEQWGDIQSFIQAELASASARQVEASQAAN